MQIIIRADASTTIGSGHIMRCLTIANILKERGHQLRFLMLPLVGNLIEYIQQQGYEVITHWQEVDIIIVDHYEIDSKMEKVLRNYARKIVVIDDLANRKHDCDVLLDQNIVENYEHRYDSLVPSSCKKLLGPQYLILRDEFIKARNQKVNRQGDVKRILVFMGGTDPTNETLKVLEALQEFSLRVHIVCGNGNPKKEEIKAICNAQGYQYHQQINYMAKLMNEVDFSIGAGGLTTWERCYLGLPSSSTIVADNQIEGTTIIEKLGAVINVGWHEEVTSETYKQLIIFIKENPTKLLQISECGLQLTKKNAQPNSWIDEILEMNK